MQKCDTYDRLHRRYDTPALSNRGVFVPALGATTPWTVSILRPEAWDAAHNMPRSASEENLSERLTPTPMLSFPRKCDSILQPF